MVGEEAWCGSQEGGEGGEVGESVVGYHDHPLLSHWAVSIWGPWSPFFPHASLSSFSGQATHSAFHELHLLPVRL